MIDPISAAAKVFQEIRDKIPPFSKGELGGAASGAATGALVDAAFGGMTLGAATGIGALIGYAGSTGIGGIANWRRKRLAENEAEAQAALAEQQAKAEAERVQIENEQAVDRAKNALAIFDRNGYKQGKVALERALELHSADFKSDAELYLDVVALVKDYQQWTP